MPQFYGLFGPEGTDPVAQIGRPQPRDPEAVAKSSEEHR